MTGKGSALYEIGARHLRLSTYILLAWAAYTVPGSFPLDEAHEWRAGWVLRVLFRNVALMWLLYGGWHYILYDSPLHANMEGKKFNKIDQYRPGTTNKSREMFYTSQGLLIGAIFECLMMHLWGTGRVPYVADFWASPVSSIGWVLFVGYWRDFHFFWIHRWMVRPALTFLTVSLGPFANITCLCAALRAYLQVRAQPAP